MTDKTCVIDGCSETNTFPLNVCAADASKLSNLSTLVEASNLTEAQQTLDNALLENTRLAVELKLSQTQTSTANDAIELLKEQLTLAQVTAGTAPAASTTCAECTTTKAELATVNKKLEEAKKVHVASLTPAVSCVKCEEKDEEIEEKDDEINDLTARSNLVEPALSDVLDLFKVTDDDDRRPTNMVAVIKLKSDLSTAEAAKVPDLETEVTQLKAEAAKVPDLKTEVTQLNAEAAKVPDLKTEVTQLKAEAAKVPDLETEVTQLKAEAAKQSKKITRLEKKKKSDPNAPLRNN
jgi:hypothetical protein